MNSKWLVWLVDHKLWRSNRSGMTPFRSQAGRYSFPDALEMVRQFQDHYTSQPFACMVPDQSEAAAAPATQDKLLEALIMQQREQLSRILKIEERLLEREKNAAQSAMYLSGLSGRFEELVKRLEGIDLHDFGARISDLEMAKNKTDARVTQFGSELRAEQRDQAARLEQVWEKIRGLQFDMASITKSKTT